MSIDKDHVYGFFRERPERPWHVQDVQKHLEIDDRAALRHALNDLTEEGRLIRTRRRTYGLPQEMNLFPGRLQVTAGGYGFVIPAEGDSKDLFIPADRLGGAWDGDKVVARPNPHKSDDGRVSGEIVRILERSNDLVVGTLEYSRGYAILRPDSPKLRERILLLPDSVGKLEAGSRIVAKMVWPEDSGEKDPFAAVQEYLGPADGDPEVETRAVIVKHGLKDAFDPATLAEAEAVPDTVTGDMMAGRTDYRHIPTFTIDGEDAKDFDDALSLERLDKKKGKGPHGMVRVGIHIADVSYYVAEGTSLDREAIERATSVYLPGRVLPMLPEELSNGICSLVEGAPRLALSVFVDMTRDGEVDAFRVKETVIQSDARLTYGQVQEYADGGRLPSGKRKLERDIKVLLGLAQKLREARMGGGALDFQFTEAKVDVDEEGALHLTPVRSNAARQLVEEMMLLANRMVAQDLDKRDIPALFRVHEDPSEDKIQALQKALAKLGYTLDLQKAKPQDLQNILREAAGKPEAQLVSTLLLRSLKQARYSAENKGHFGLAFDNYLHFTSPIRRYPDLVVHRVVRASLQHRLSPTLKERMKSDFPQLAEHASERERVAEDAERDLTRYFHAKWASEHIGETFQGTVSGVTNFGVFVALGNGIEGLVHVSHLDDDYYMFLEDSLMLMGKHSRKKFRMGDRIEVKIYQANPTIRQIDLILGSMEMPETDPVADEAPTLRPAPRKVKDPLEAGDEGAKAEARGTGRGRAGAARKDGRKDGKDGKDGGRKAPARKAGARKAAAAAEPRPDAKAETKAGARADARTAEDEAKPQARRSSRRTAASEAAAPAAPKARPATPSRAERAAAAAREEAERASARAEAERAAAREEIERPARPSRKVRRVLVFGDPSRWR